MEKNFWVRAGLQDSMDQRDVGPRQLPLQRQLCSSISLPVCSWFCMQPYSA